MTKPLNNPLQNIQCSGLHLIEASAGTGKTWTLSSLIVRILLEPRGTQPAFEPNQVVATTFTRAAAAELKNRIRKRLQEVRGWSLAWLEQPQPSTHDALEQLLFERCFSLADNKDYPIHRVDYILNRFDELFVGTIDSFTQKLLREFAFESGEFQTRQLSEDEKIYQYQIVHDSYRKWIQKQPQQVLDVLILKNKLANTDFYLDKIDKILNFKQAKLKNVTEPNFDFLPLLEKLQYIVKVYVQDKNNFQKYTTGEYAEYISGTYFKGDSFSEIFNLILPNLVKNLPSQIEQILDEALLEQLEKVKKIVFDGKNKRRTTIFTKNIPKPAEDWFMQHLLLNAIADFFEAKKQIDNQFKQLQAYLFYYFACQLREQLPKLLNQAGETTFSEQQNNLSEAFNQQQGEQFAQAVFHKYPVILVDEFQDTNQGQDDVLKIVWRNHQRFHQGCFIAVGDPKQAIYAFRGGDTLTYNNAKYEIIQKGGKIYQLAENFRSVPCLVEQVDYVFQQNTDFGESILYYPAKANHENVKQLIEITAGTTQINHAPLRTLTLDVEQQKSSQHYVAAQIYQLLNSAQQNQLYLQENEQQTLIQPNDIAVLARTGRDLKAMQQILQGLNIPTVLADNSSVFASNIAIELLAVLNAISRSNHEATLRRALISPFFANTLTDLEQFSLELYIQHFRQVYQCWLQQGILTAWKMLANFYPIWQNLADYSAEQAQRNVVNIQHLLELLAERNHHHHSPHHVLSWYQLQLGAPLQRDWEIERPLTNASGVQLMTIHKSKGLEFKIVFVLAANQAPRKIQPEDIRSYTQEQNGQKQRVLALSQAAIADYQQAEEENQLKLESEQHRLSYVALTRASLRLYLVLNQQDIDKNGNQLPSKKYGVDYWLHADGAKYQPTVEPIIELNKSLRYQSILDQPVHLHAIAYPITKYYPASKTSFSALSNYQHSAIDHLAQTEQLEKEQDEQIENTISPIIYNTAEISQIVPILSYLPKGTKVGDCLHHILQEIDFTQSDTWLASIRYHISSLNLSIESKQIEQELHDWFVKIITTPLNEQLCLQNIQMTQRISECDFLMSCAKERFYSEPIVKLLEDYQLIMPKLNRADTARHITGSIDLVFYDGKKYCIADYKSSYLGEQFADYTVANIHKNMQSSSYYLQASLYLVALHRYLKQQLIDYNIHQHLGGAYYLYLRGMVGVAGYGVLHWQPDVDFILKLDQLLGAEL